MHIQKSSISILFTFLCLFCLLPNGASAEKRYDIPISQSPQFGPADAAVTIIEFVDFQ